jgi:hypothetical protein
VSIEKEERCMGLNSVHDDLARAISNTVAQQVAQQSRSSNVTTLTITEAALTEQIGQQLDNDGLSSDDVVVYIYSPNQLVIGLQFDSREITYTAELGVRNGQLVVEDIEANEDLVRRLLPEGKVGDGIEDGVNEALFAENLELQSVTTTTGRLILEVATGPTSS